jgi:hypothetical protein
MIVATTTTTTTTTTTPVTTDGDGTPLGLLTTPFERTFNNSTHHGTSDNHNSSIPQQHDRISSQTHHHLSLDASSSCCGEIPVDERDEESTTISFHKIPCDHHHPDRPSEANGASPVVVSVKARRSIQYVLFIGGISALILIVTTVILLLRRSSHTNDSIPQQQQQQQHQQQQPATSSTCMLSSRNATAATVPFSMNTTERCTRRQVIFGLDPSAFINHTANGNDESYRTMATIINDFLWIIFCRRYSNTTTTTTSENVTNTMPAADDFLVQNDQCTSPPWVALSISSSTVVASPASTVFRLVNYYSKIHVALVDIHHSINIERLRQIEGITYVFSTIPCLFVCLFCFC